MPGAGARRRLSQEAERWRQLSEAEIARRLAAERPDWRYRDGGIERTLKTAEWKETIMAANAIAFLAEAANHHPDLGAALQPVGHSPQHA